MEGPWLKCKAGKWKAQARSFRKSSLRPGASKSGRSIQTEALVNWKPQIHLHDPTPSLRAAPPPCGGYARWSRSTSVTVVELSAVRSPCGQASKDAPILLTHVAKAIAQVWTNQLQARLSGFRPFSLKRARLAAFNPTLRECLPAPAA